MAPKKGSYLAAHELWKQKFAASGLSYSFVARELGCSTATVSEFFNKGYVPARLNGFLGRIEALLRSNGVIDGTEAGSAGGRDGGREGKYWEDDERMSQQYKIERQLLSRRCLTQFGLQWDPWYEKHHPYQSKEFTRVADDLLDCVERIAFCAVIGQVGWGKSTLVQHVKGLISQKLPHVLLAEVTVDEKREIETKHIRDAVLEALDTDLEGGRQRRSTQFRRILAEQRERGKILCVLVDDAQWVTPRMFAQFKLFSELEDGYRRLLGIVLVGQAPELTHRLNAIRAAGWRAHRIYLHGLAAETKAYIEQRIKVAGGSAGNIITPAALERLCEIMQQKHLDYPLPLSALMSLMMARAYELGERKVPKEMIEEFFTPIEMGAVETARQRDLRRLSPELGGPSRIAAAG